MSNREIQRLEDELKNSKAKLSARWRTLEGEVTKIIGSAKTEITEAVQKTKETVSIRHQVSVRPWSMIAASVLTGFAFSRAFGLRNLAFVGLANSLLKNAPTTENVKSTSYPRVSPTNNLSQNSKLIMNHEAGLIDSLRIQAIVSLSDIAKNLVKKNVHSSFVPIIEQAISHSTDNLLSSSSSVAKTLTSEKRVINDKGESVSVH